MDLSKLTPQAIAEEMGGRLKQARLNANLSQETVATQAGVSRRTVIQAEKGKVQLETMIAIMTVIGVTNHLNKFLPVQLVSPVQLSELHGKQRKNASPKKARDTKESLGW